MADDPFIEIRWVDHTARWFCTSCGQADDTPYVTEESARIAGEDHCCVDYLLTEGTEQT